MRTLLYTLTAVTFLLAGCGKKELTYKKELVNGVEVITNDGRPADSTFKLNIKEAAAIDCNQFGEKDTNEVIQLNNVELDQFGNIYVLDSRRSKIHKFAPDGKKLISFGNRGQGPGEFINVGFFVVWHDTVYVPFILSQKILKFNLDGKYITEKRYAGVTEFPQIFWKTTKFVNGVTITPLPNEGSNVFERCASIFDDKLNKLRTFIRQKADTGLPVIDINLFTIPSLAVSADSLVYVPKFSTSEYVIDVFDLQGNKKQVIRKRYRSVPYTENELAPIKQGLARNNQTTNTTLKNAIGLISIDKYNRLWVVPARPEGDNNGYYDIFDKGIYINTVKVPADPTTIVDFVEGKMTIFDAVTNKLKYCDY